MRALIIRIAAAVFNFIGGVFAGYRLGVGVRGRTWALAQRTWILRQARHVASRVEPKFHSRKELADMIVAALTGR